MGRGRWLRKAADWRGGLSHEQLASADPAGLEEHLGVLQRSWVFESGQFVSHPGGCAHLMHGSSSVKMCEWYGHVG